VIEEEKRKKFEEEKSAYEKLTAEQKKQRLLEGLYSYNWTTEDGLMGHS
jgi:hypothetical protein